MTGIDESKDEMPSPDPEDDVAKSQTAETNPPRSVRDNVADFARALALVYAKRARPVRSERVHRV